MAAQSLRTSVSLCRFPRLVSALGFRGWFPRLVSAAVSCTLFSAAVSCCCCPRLFSRTSVCFAATVPFRRTHRTVSVLRSAPYGTKKGRIRRTDTPAWPYAAGRGLLLDYLELVLANAAKRANPILGNIFECRAGGDATFGVADCRVINPIAYGATILFHLFLIAEFNLQMQQNSD
jgi:hypothetical protein